MEYYKNYLDLVFTDATYKIAADPNLKVIAFTGISEFGGKLLLALAIVHVETAKDFNSVYHIQVFRAPVVIVVDRF